MSKKAPDYDYEEAEAAGLGYMRFSLIQSCAIDDVRVTDSMLKVLIALGSHAHKKHGHWCWAKEVTIAQRLGVSRRLVRQATSALRDCGYLEIAPAFKEDGGQIRNSYRLLMDFELPAEYVRSDKPRPRAGIGGYPTHTPRNSEFQGGRNSEFQGGRNSEFQDGGNLEFQGGRNSEFHPLNTEPENEKRKRKGKRLSPHLEQKNAEGASPPHHPTVTPITEVRRDMGGTLSPPIAPAPLSPAPGVWMLVRAELESMLSPVQRREWLERLDFYHVEGDEWAIAAPTPYAAQFVENRWGRNFRTALQHAAGPDASLLFVSAPSTKGK